MKISSFIVVWREMLPGQKYWKLIHLLGTPIVHWYMKPKDSSGK